MLSQSEINQFNKDGAVLIKGKFEKHWIEKLRNGINEDINNPSPRFVRHTKGKDVPGYFEDFWTWNLYKDFRDFVFNSPTAQIASELLEAKEGSRIDYRGDWAQEERAIMEANGYQNGDDLGSKMFPTLYTRL